MRVKPFGSTRRSEKSAWAMEDLARLRELPADARSSQHPKRLNGLQQ
jgi:hypothetical protein